MFSMFGRTEAPQKEAPRAREDLTARHFLACLAYLWRAATFRSSLGAARRSVAWGTGSMRRFAKSEFYDVTYLFLS